MLLREYVNKGDGIKRKWLFCFLSDLCGQATYWGRFMSIILGQAACCAWNHADNEICMAGGQDLKIYTSIVTDIGINEQKTASDYIINTTHFRQISVMIQQDAEREKHKQPLSPPPSFLWSLHLCFSGKSEQSGTVVSADCSSFPGYK